MFKNVVIAAMLLLCSTAVFGQMTISGTVESARGERLPNANITIENTTKGTVGDVLGRFVFKDLAAGTYTLRATFVGYAALSKTITLTDRDVSVNFQLVELPQLNISPIIAANAIRAGRNTPMSFYTMDKEELAANNLGQDVPYLLQMTPSTVVTSDAGTGIGYTGIRIRGSDPSRINVTVNGIPLNDAESQTVFWVNMPDFASSTSSIQIQRGVGTSTNGAGAFGGTINMATNGLKAQKPEFGISTSVGSFGTFRSNLHFDTGLKGKFNLNGRASYLTSDGYIDRASANLWSYYLSGSYLDGRNSLEFIAFHGKEVTYQAWYGIDPITLQENRRFNPAGTESDPPYDNQVDDYQQTHYQLLYKHRASKVHFDGALHYTRGKGFYEEYKAEELPYNYGLTDDLSVIPTDLVRQRWLDNHFLGGTYAVTFFADKKETDLIIGGAANVYLGDHFGEVIWVQAADFANISEENPRRYYENVGTKTDVNIYGKLNQDLGQNVNGFLDLQYRFVRHDIEGFDNDGREVTQTKDFHFFNPKVGMTFRPTQNSTFYASYAVANREPSRSDMTDAPSNIAPQSEQLHDLEAGHRWQQNRFSFDANLYYMRYRNQLVLTGLINDVGAPIRANVPNSYRLGLELVGGGKLADWLELRANATFSRNKVLDFVEYLDDWDNGGQRTIEHGTTDIAFSPSVTAAAELIFTPLQNTENHFEIALMSKYVGEQFMDNSSSTTSILDDFWTNDVRLVFVPKLYPFKKLEFSFLVRNVFNTLYESNAWIYRFYENNEVQQFVGLYPQAGVQFLGGINLTF